MSKLPKLLGILLAFLPITCYSGNYRVATKHPVRASFYAPRFEGRVMANGHQYHNNVVSAASMVFPLGTKVRVTNIKTGTVVNMVITDRGPWHTRFSIDLSAAAFEALGFDKKQGWGWVTVEKITK